MAGCLGASQAKEDPGKPWGGLELSEELRVSLEQTCLSVLVGFRRWLKCGPQEPRAMEDVVAQVNILGSFLLQVLSQNLFFLNPQTALKLGFSLFLV